jgi:hypothetical protein
MGARVRRCRRKSVERDGRREGLAVDAHVGLRPRARKDLRARRRLGAEPERLADVGIEQRGKRVRVRAPLPPVPNVRLFAGGKGRGREGGSGRARRNAVHGAKTHKVAPREQEVGEVELKLRGVLGRALEPVHHETRLSGRRRAAERAQVGGAARVLHDGSWRRRADAVGSAARPESVRVLGGVS